MGIASHGQRLWNKERERAFARPIKSGWPASAPLASNHRPLLLAAFARWTKGKGARIHSNRVLRCKRRRVRNETPMLDPVPIEACPIHFISQSFNHHPAHDGRFFLRRRTIFLGIGALPVDRLVLRNKLVTPAQGAK